MEANETNVWRDSAWFQRWLELAREHAPEDKIAPEDVDDGAKPEELTHHSKAAQFVPPFGEWNFTLREQSTLTLSPKHVLACTLSNQPRQATLFKW